MGKKLTCLMFLFLVLAMTGTVPAANKTWDNQFSDKKWEEPNNWDVNGVPTSADVAYINKGTAGGADECLIGSGITGTAGTLYLAATDGTTGALAVNSGAIDSYGHTYVGEKGTPTLNISGGTISQKATTGRSLYIGGSASGSTGVGTVNVTNSSVLDFNNVTGCSLIVGNYSTGTLNVTNSTLKFSKDVTIGMYAGGNGTLTLTNSLLKADSTGSILRIGDGGIANSGTVVGTLNVDGGTILLGTGGIRCGHTGNSGIATINMTSGLINSPYEASSGIRLPNNGTATLNMSGGTFNVSKMALPNEATAKSGVIHLSGGVINFSGGGLTMRSNGHIEIGAPARLSLPVIRYLPTRAILIMAGLQVCTARRLHLL